MPTLAETIQVEFTNVLGALQCRAGERMIEAGVKLVARGKRAFTSQDPAPHPTGPVAPMPTVTLGAEALRMIQDGKRTRKKEAPVAPSPLKGSAQDLRQQAAARRAKVG